MNIEQKLSDAPLRAEWRPDLLGGVMVISGKWADGSPLLAIPNYARMNRVGQPHPYPRDEEIENVPSAGSNSTGRSGRPTVESKIWI
jgi:hypothetical protein